MPDTQSEIVGFEYIELHASVLLEIVREAEGGRTTMVVFASNI